MACQRGDTGTMETGLIFVFTTLRLGFGLSVVVRIILGLNMLCTART